MCTSFGYRSVHFLKVRFAWVIGQEGKQSTCSCFSLSVMLCYRSVFAPPGRSKKPTRREQAYSIVYAIATLFQDIVTGMDSEISSVLQKFIAYVKEINTNQLFSIFFCYYFWIITAKILRKDP